ncbi:MAG: 8-amino-7-oxononanoate synthase [Arenimonas sp. SCN 70-307]|uniref:8-amino-7-oxononanoate synthase n=1 Tax=Arenimonas sp. SCN 70-307 TaxID=1660089 RepID=UPI00086C9851|nr:8-amino-7-oxononanoate synthase [Arenimonas sp. SCN 70-307]ODS61300.1 MAG: 8-amino-7-oxononanoate synthase [Arenimonas sp. SCN 70-307]
MPRIRFADRIALARAERAARDALRPRRMIEGREGARVLVDGRPLVNFCGNDYLGLGQHLDVVAALQEAAAWHGVGSTGSALVCGHHAEHAAFENDMAQWLGYERGLFFGSGYQANLAVMQSLLADGDLCVQDKLNHACLLDGARLSGAELKRYPHGDVEAAMRQLMSRREGAAMLTTDGVFSMDGDQAPLADLALVARTQDALLYVDDAHGIGVLGPEGRGSLAVAGLGAREVPLLLLPLGKAFGGQGAMLLGSEALVGHVAETARPYLFSTAPAPAMAAAMRASLKLVRREAWRRAKLMSLVMRFRRGAAARGLPVQESFTPIQPVVLGDNARALAASKALEAAGYLVAAIRPPTVPEGQARLRITLSTDHAEADVDGLLEALARAVNDTPQPLPA